MKRRDLFKLTGPKLFTSKDLWKIRAAGFVVSAYSTRTCIKKIFYSFPIDRTDTYGMMLGHKGEKYENC